MKRNPKPFGYFMHAVSTGFKLKATAIQKRSGNTFIGVMKLIMLIALSLFVSAMFASFLGCSPVWVALVMFALGFIPQKEKGVAMMAVNLNQAIVAKLLERFIALKDDFLGDIKDYSGLVNNDVIKFNDIGDLPDVLINNAIYPIATTARTDVGKTVSLYKLDTKNTPITDDELHALPYDKKSSVMDDHVLALNQAKIKLGIYSLAPAADSANTPVLQTTGAIDPVTGRSTLTFKDILALKLRCDNLQIPLESRKLILCANHVNDLLNIDALNTFRERYTNGVMEGKVIAQLAGFKMFENLLNPSYDSTGALKAYGSAAAVGDKSASVFFSNVNTMKAIGSASVYYRDASLDPENRQSVIGMRLWYIVSPVNNKGIGAIIDGPTGA